MKSERLTITLPSPMAKAVRAKARKTGKPVSQIIAGALAQQDRLALRALAIEGYRAGAKEAQAFAEDAIAIAAEDWPED